MTKFKLLFLAALTVASITACGSKISQENFNKISNGTSQAEVVALLGEPQSSQGGGVLGLSAGTAVWKDDKNKISVVFVNEKVTSKLFGAEEPSAK